MALLHADKFDKVVKYRNTIHKSTVATYTSFVEAESKYFQIDTYGSDERVMPEKVSQTIQIDKTMAKKLIEILKKEFDL